MASAQYYEKVSRLQDVIRTSETRRLELESEFNNMLRNCSSRNEEKMQKVQEIWQYVRDREDQMFKRNEQLLLEIQDAQQYLRGLRKRTEEMRAQKNMCEVHLDRLYPGWRHEHSTTYTRPSSVPVHLQPSLPPPRPVIEVLEQDTVLQTAPEITPRPSSSIPRLNLSQLQSTGGGTAAGGYSQLLNSTGDQSTLLTSSHSGPRLATTGDQSTLLTSSHSGPRLATTGDQSTLLTSSHSGPRLATTGDQSTLLTSSHSGPGSSDNQLGDTVIPAPSFRKSVSFSDDHENGKDKSGRSTTSTLKSSMYSEPEKDDPHEELNLHLSLSSSQEEVSKFHDVQEVHLSMKGLFHMLMFVEGEVDEAQNRKSYYRSSIPGKTVVDSVIDLANKSQSLDSFNSVSISMIILETLVPISESLEGQCLLHDRLLNKLHSMKTLTSMNLQQEFTSTKQVLWTRLFQHMIHLVRRGSGSTREISDLFTPSLLHRDSRLEVEAIEVVERVLEQHILEDPNAETDTSRSFSPTPRLHVPKKLGVMDSLKATAGSFQDDEEEDEEDAEVELGVTLNPEITGTSPDKELNFYVDKMKQQEEDEDEESDNLSVSVTNTNVTNMTGHVTGVTDESVKSSAAYRMLLGGASSSGKLIRQRSSVESEDDSEIEHLVTGQTSHTGQSLRASSSADSDRLQPVQESMGSDLHSTGTSGSGSATTERAKTLLATKQLLEKTTADSDLSDSGSDHKIETKPASKLVNDDFDDDFYDNEF